MKTVNVLLSAAIGTAAMTLFSYFLSGKKDKEFKEPELLSKMVNRAFPSVSKTPAAVSGWLMHANMGFVFAFIYKEVMKKIQYRRDLSNDVFIGVANGIAGVILWKLVFSLHPNPPRIHFSRFYQHLILAHLIFSATTLSVMDENGQGIE